MKSVCAIKIGLVSLAAKGRPSKVGADRDEVLVLAEQVGCLPTDDGTLLVLVFAPAVASLPTSTVCLRRALATLASRSAAKPRRLADATDAGAARGEGSVDGDEVNPHRACPVGRLALSERLEVV
jgi:hypothetical protein